MAVEELPKEKVSSYGIIKGRAIKDSLYTVEDIVEKPTIEEAPSNIGSVGRYILTPEIFKCIKKTPPGVNNEIQLTDALRLLKEKESIYAFEFHGKRYDLGNKMDWLKTTFDVALMRNEFRDEYMSYAKNKIKDMEEVC